MVNQQLRLAWDEFELTPSRSATDFEFCRRVFLDLLGRIPTISELNEYRSDKSGEKKSQLINRLLYDKKYEPEYARHWSTIWTLLLIGRSGGENDDNFTNRAGMLSYLREAFAENRPYDKIVHELVSATGTNVPGSDGFNGAVNFLIGKLDEKGAQATAQTSKLFLGMQVQCTQCHNHPFNEWKQNQFWGMNSFFRQAVALRRFEPDSNMVSKVELANQDFGGEDLPLEAEAGRIYFELRNGKLEAATPVFLDGSKINPSGYVEDSDRRTQLADLIVKSEYMPMALVNRMWAHFFGYGFTKPIDDMGPHNLPSHPALLNHLSQEFKKNSFDIKQLMRWMVLSDAYALSSKMVKGNQHDDPLLGETPKFSHFYLRPMTAEQLYESLIVATAAHKTGDGDQQDRNKWLRQFVITFGTDEGDESTTFNGTIPQTLMMFNGELMKQATSATSGSYLHQVANDPKLNEKKRINQLYLAALARTPDKTERKIADQLLSARKGDVTAALQDVWWALLNSNEFILNH